MKRSKIIIELIKDEINVVQAMDILNLLLQDAKYKKIKKWVDNEINGYSKTDKLPQYRILKSNIKGTFIGVGFECKNQNIPVKPEYVEKYTKVNVISSVSEILQLSIAEKESKEHCLAIPLHQVLAQDISMVNGEIISASRELSIYAYTNILGKIKTKVLQILIELEKEYGNLDNYCIDFNEKPLEKSVVKNITNIIYTDNSVHIGNDNKIEKSNVGVENESWNRK